MASSFLGLQFDHSFVDRFLITCHRARGMQSDPLRAQRNPASGDACDFEEIDFHDPGDLSCLSKNQHHHHQQHKRRKVIDSNELNQLNHDTDDIEEEAEMNQKRSSLSSSEPFVHSHVRGTHQSEMASRHHYTTIELIAIRDSLRKDYKLQTP